MFVDISKNHFPLVKVSFHISFEERYLLVYGIQKVFVSWKEQVFHQTESFKRVIQIPAEIDTVPEFLNCRLCGTTLLIGRRFFSQSNSALFIFRKMCYHKNIIMLRNTAEDTACSEPKHDIDIQEVI